jgi:outer membrane protein assembly factor BamA
MRTTQALRLLAALALAGAAPAVLRAPPALAASGDTMMFTLDSVTFEGNQRVSTDTLNSVVGLEKGQQVNRDSIVQAFQNVTDEYKKENVGGTIQPVMKLSGKHMSVVFQISELAPAAPVTVQPVLDHETFTGNVKISSERLAPALTIKPGTPVTKEMIIADMNALSAVYKGANQSVLITPKMTTLPEGHLDLNFELNENPPKKE